MDNWRKLKFYGFKGAWNTSESKTKDTSINLKLIDQHKKEEAVFPDSIVNTTKASFAAITSLKEGKWVSIE